MMVRTKSSKQHGVRKSAFLLRTRSTNRDGPASSGLTGRVPASYLALVQGLPDIIMRFDRAHRHLFVSENVVTVTGLPAERFLNRTHRELGFDADQCMMWESAIDRVFSEGAPLETEFEFEGPSGTLVFNWRLVPELDSVGAVSSVLSLTRDITLQRRAELDYQMLFREMLDGIAVHEVVCDAENQPVDYRFLAVNPAFERLTGLRGQEILGRTALEVVPDLEHHWIERYGRVALTGEPVSFESYSAGLGRHFQVTAFRPRPLQFVCIFVDVTERRRAEAERAELESQLHQAQKLESLGRLAGGIAHDFNTMLGVILGNADLMMANLEPRSSLYEDLMEIRRAAERSAALTERLLAFARQTPKRARLVDLNLVVTDAVKMLRRLIGESIELRFSPSVELWPVELDPSQLDQVLANLCVNARDAIAGAGTITLRIENREVATTPGNGSGAPGDYVVLEVRDSGSGMDEATLARAFEPFFTTKPVGRGTGLGLSMVYGIVAQMGGFVDVWSEPKRGTRVSVFLPRALGQVASTGKSAPPDPSRSQGETILLVEDEPAMLKIAARILTTEGYSVLVASGPTDAVELARTHPQSIDLLLTDVVMPERDGFDLANQLEELQPRMKRLFMSGYATPTAGDKPPILRLPGDFIQKPFARSELVRKVREILERE
jgi:two-component system, cell cycle sensor histidine kinase and response regulator CckA